jgi:hypothetical protein
MGKGGGEGTDCNELLVSRVERRTEYGKFGELGVMGVELRGAWQVLGWRKRYSWTGWRL